MKIVPIVLAAASIAAALPAALEQRRVDMSVTAASPGNEKRGDNVDQLDNTAWWGKRGNNVDELDNTAWWGKKEKRGDNVDELDNTAWWGKRGEDVDELDNTAWWGKKEKRKAED